MSTSFSWRLTCDRLVSHLEEIIDSHASIVKFLLCSLSWPNWWISTSFCWWITCDGQEGVIDSHVSKVKPYYILPATGCLRRRLITKWYISGTSTCFDRSWFKLTNPGTLTAFLFTSKLPSSLADAFTLNPNNIEKRQKIPSFFNKTKRNANIFILYPQDLSNKQNKTKYI